MKGLGAGGRFGWAFLCWRCRRAAARLRRHAGVEAIGGVRAVLELVGEELEIAHHRGMLKAARRDANIQRWLRVCWGPKPPAISLIEYPVNLRVFPSGPTLRKLH